VALRQQRLNPVQGPEAYRRKSVWPAGNAHCNTLYPPFRAVRSYVPCRPCRDATGGGEEVDGLAVASRQHTEPFAVPSSVAPVRPYAE